MSDSSASRLSSLKNEWRHQDAGRDDHNQVCGLIDLIEYTKPQSVLEIGSHVGVSTEAFLLLCSDVTAVDCWGDNRFYDQFVQRCRPYPHLTIVKGTSPDILKTIHRQFDLVYIDADHAQNSVRADIDGAWPLIKEGGWISGHDYSSSIHGVFPTVNDRLGTPEKVFSDTSWVVRKN